MLTSLDYFEVSISMLWTIVTNYTYTSLLRKYQLRVVELLFWVINLGLVILFLKQLISIFWRSDLSLEKEVDCIRPVNQMLYPLHLIL